MLYLKYLNLNFTKTKNIFMNYEQLIAVKTIFYYINKRLSTNQQSYKNRTPRFIEHGKYT